mgnify:CR=1 FL=1
MRLGHALAILALALAPAVVAAQDQPRGPGGAMQRLRRNPVAAILERRADLQLTNEQVAKLEAIRKKLDEQNAPLLAKLDEARGNAPGGGAPASDEQREAMRQRMAELRPVLQQVRENNRKAIEEASAVLTPEQRQKVRGILEPPAPRRPGSDRPPIPLRR